MMGEPKLHVLSFLKLLPILSLMIQLQTHLTSSFPIYLYHICSNDTTSSITHQKNVDTLLRSLSSNAASTNTDSFYASSAGTGTKDAVYGLYNCRGDQTATSCSNCVSTATIELPNSYCPKTNSKVGTSSIIWYDECMLRYSNETILGKMVDFPISMLTNTAVYLNFNQTNLLVKTLTSLVNDLSRKMLTNYKRYGTKEANLDNFNVVYSLEQCTPELSGEDCDRCLKTGIRSLVSSQQSMEVKQGGIVLMPSCLFRYELYKFYNTTLPPPPPPPLSSHLTGTNSSDTPTIPKEVSSKRRARIVAFVIVPVSLIVLLFLGVLFSMHRRKGTEKRQGTPTDEMTRFANSLQYEFSTLRSATRNFAEENKLGEGGFGQVYKGRLESGQDIAVKRLSKNSGQGIAEFETEIILVARLQHKNLVKLLGYCATPKESLLVYEFLPNSSLDRLLFDPMKKESLKWQTRFKIIGGIARGLMYLHEDSRIKVVHRDLKSSNILLDEKMNPKIADFGLARLFGVDETQCDTKRIVGTYGYMAPEYVITGHYSAKSDVYSFGVIVLEIISGQKNRLSRRLQVEEALLHRAWRLWNEDAALDLVDTELGGDFTEEEVVKCIQIGLLCIQEDAIDRPQMTSIVAALNGQAVSLPTPKSPHFFRLASNPDDVDEQNATLCDAPNVYSGTKMITVVYSRD